MINTVIITAGGSGNRLPGKIKKQFRLLNFRPILYHTIDKFINHPEITHIIITLPGDDFASITKTISHEFKDNRITFCKGGVERQESVLNALKQVPANTDYVLIHDGVRPFITKELISKLLSLAIEYGASIPISSVKNTIKQVDAGLVSKTIPRDNLYSVHTPQVFDYKKLLNLHLRASQEKITFTDDASIFEFYKEPVATLVSEINNIKITDSLDLEVAKLIMKGNEMEK
ncbi:MAG: 2-C-methyl-D-erythritol 4-phosphate cytidylyltransferase [Candidatus Zophobacter franzmannii]|nr:2-C-methyl-D-erythritol 4-phosphate cytidylyltransferase [Candidatus Zophobacter franzmannii]